MRTIDLVKRRMNPTLDITGVIPCMYDSRKGLARETVVEIERHFGNKVFKSRIRTNVRLAEAPSHGRCIFDYAPESYGAEDYLALGREIAGIQMLEEIPDLPLPAKPAEAPPAELSEQTPLPVPLISPPDPQPSGPPPGGQVVDFVPLPEL
jgi:hypothetical protein